jgi:hypothetical protein
LVGDVAIHAASVKTIGNVYKVKQIHVSAPQPSSRVPSCVVWVRGCRSFHARMLTEQIVQLSQALKTAGCCFVMRVLFDDANEPCLLGEARDLDRRVSRTLRSFT